MDTFVLRFIIQYILQYSEIEIKVLTRYNKKQDFSIKKRLDHIQTFQAERLKNKLLKHKLHKIYSGR